MTVSSSLAEAGLHEEIHLLGVPSLANFVDHVKRRSVGGDKAEDAALIDQWRAAATRYEALEKSQAGEADLVEVSAIPASRAKWIDQLLEDPSFSQGFGDLPLAFVMVELDRLVIHQQHISLTHAQAFQTMLEQASDREQKVFEICLPPEPQPLPISSFKSGGGKFVFQSELSDIRGFSPRLLSEQTAATVLTPNGHATAGIVIPVGFGARHLNVVRLGKRMVLNNGYHRAYAMRAAGVTHVPCVVQAISHPEELAFAGGSSLIDNFDELFKSQRPPMFKDFFDPQLTARLQLPRTRKQIQITVTIETLRVPGW